MKESCLVATHNRVVFEERSGEEWIRVVDLFPEQHRYLHFRHSIQGVMSLVDHSLPVLEYVGVMCYGAKQLVEAPRSVLVGGLGSCTTLHTLSSFWKKNARFQVVESNPTVIGIARRFFRLSENQEVVQGDFREDLEQAQPGSYDLMAVDCYSSNFVPPHLMTVEFIALVRDRLSEGGFAVFNIWSPSCNRICGHQVRTMLEVFGEVAVATCREDDNILVFVGRKERIPWPLKLSFRGVRYALSVLQLGFRSFWPEFMRESRIITDENLLEFIKIQFYEHES